MKPIVGFADLWWARFGVRPPVLPKMSGTPLLGGLLRRASCRRYKPEPVPEGLLNLILAAAQSAPSKSDLQQYSIIMVEDPAIRRTVNKWRSMPKWVAEAPHMLIFCADIRRQQAITHHRDKVYRNNSVDHYTNAVSDASLALGFAIAAAEATGLGCCPLSVVRNHIEEATQLFDLPSGVFPLAGLALGGRQERDSRSLRLPPDVVVHRDKYSDIGMLREIDRYDDRRHARKPIPRSSQLETDRYGVADRYTWSEDKARRLSVRERPEFLEYLKRQGFDLD